MPVLENSDQQSLSPNQKREVLEHIREGLGVAKLSFSALDIGFSHTARKIKLEAGARTYLVKFSRDFQDIEVLRKKLPVVQKISKSVSIVNVLKFNSGDFLCEIPGLKAFYVMEFVEKLRPLKIPVFHQAIEIIQNIHAVGYEGNLPSELEKISTYQLAQEMLSHYSLTASTEAMFLSGLLIADLEGDCDTTIIHSDALFSNFGETSEGQVVLVDIDEMGLGHPVRDVATVALSWFGINFIGWTSSLHPVLQRSPDWVAMKGVLDLYNNSRNTHQIPSKIFWIEVWNQMIEIYTLGLIRGDVTYSDVRELLLMAFLPKFRRLFVKKGTS